MSSDRFPEHLLQAPTRDRYDYFRHWHVAHPHLIAASQTLQQTLQFGDRNEIILLFGCTGVGKTTLRRWLEKTLTVAAADKMAADPDYIPVASVVTPAPDQGPFSWRDVYIQTLHVLGEPAAFVRSRNRPRNLQFHPTASISITPRTPRSDLRLAMVGCLHQRAVDVLFYDDAQHLQMVSRAQRLQDQMENLKWLSEVSDTTIVLLGTYDVLNLIDLSGQLARRSTTIHFARYRADVDVELQQFTNIIYAFQRQLPLPTTPNLVERRDYLYEHTLGSVGLLKRWLERVLAVVLTRDDAVIDEPLLESCLDKRALLAVAKEAVAGEQRFFAMQSRHTELNSLLHSAARLPHPLSPTPSVAPTRTNSVKPGQRKPHRDVVKHGGTPNG